MTLTELPKAAGIGLRHPHHEEFAKASPSIAWIEVHSENFMGGGAGLSYLKEISSRYPVSLHGVGLSLGSAEGINQDHLKRLADLVKAVQPAAISEHVSWSVTGGHYYNDLLPLPYTKEAFSILANNIALVQEKLKRPILIENPSTYLQYEKNDMSESTFIAELCNKTGCGLLLDINNVIVAAFNHQFEPKDYIDALAGVPVGEYHLAGHHTRMFGNRGIKIDDHGSEVPAEVWQLFGYALDKIGLRPTLIERDSALPSLSALLQEAKKAQAYLDAA